MQLFDQVSLQASKLVTKQYSTSFSLGSLLLEHENRSAIYAIYGFVRFADEIVDTFHAHDRESLLKKFREDTWTAIAQGISLNPILHSFQQVVRKYGIREAYIESFFRSMEMDLVKHEYDRNKYDAYIVGSAEVVGLMCLQVFCKGNEAEFRRLEEPARKLGAAFQKVNFLRDLRDDWKELGLVYFPWLDLHQFNETAKAEIEKEIDADFQEALKGIKALPAGSKAGVYVAYVYYLSLFKRIRSKKAPELFHSRIRVPNYLKFGLMVQSLLKIKLNLV